MSGRDVIAYLIRWRRRHLGDNQFLLLISFLVGIFIALAGLMLKWLIASIEHLLTRSFSLTDAIIIEFALGLPLHHLALIIKSLAMACQIEFRHALRFT